MKYDKQFAIRNWQLTIGNFKTIFIENACGF